MKKISIVYNQSLKLIQGINYVNNSFVMGGKYFLEHGLELSKIYAPDGVFDCSGKERLSLIGSDIGTPTYNWKRRVRVVLRELLSADYLPGAFIKLYINHIRNGRLAANNLLKNKDESDYLIFQDSESLYNYYNNRSENSHTKTILILHCSIHPLEQLVPQFKGYFKHNILKEKYFNRCEDAINLADKVVYLSKHAEDNSPITNEKKTYIFNGIEDLDGIVVEPVSKPLQLVSVGSVTIRKGQHLLIEALALLHNDIKEQIHLTLVGGGTEFEMCNNLIADHHLEKTVTMLGPRNDVAELLKGMDVFLLPSKSEGMPMSILEAMRQGMYIMASETGGIPEMIEEGYGELISRDPKIIADSISRMVLEKKVTTESKMLARKRYEKDFTLKKMIDHYSSVLLSL